MLLTSLDWKRADINPSNTDSANVNMAKQMKLVGNDLRAPSQQAMAISKTSVTPKHTHNIHGFAAANLLVLSLNENRVTNPKVTNN